MPPSAAGAIGFRCERRGDVRREAGTGLTADRKNHASRISARAAALANAREQSPAATESAAEAEPLHAADNRLRIAMIRPRGVDRTGEYRVIPALLALIERLARATTYRCSH